MYLFYFLYLLSSNMLQLIWREETKKKARWRVTALRRGNLKICTAHADVGQGGAEILVAHSIPLRRCAR